MWAYPVITLLELLPGVVSFQLERQKGGLSHDWKDGQVKRQEHTIWLITSELWCFPDSKCQGMLYFKTNPAPNIDLCIQHHFSCEAKALKRSVFHMAARNCSHPLKFEIFSSKNCKMQMKVWKDWSQSVVSGETHLKQFWITAKALWHLADSPITETGQAHWKAWSALPSSRR